MKWASSGLLSVSPSSVKQIIQSRKTLSGTLPIRCVVANKNFKRGELIALVPSQAVLGGEPALRLLREYFLSSNVKSDTGVDCVLRKILELEPPNLPPSLLWSRDALLSISLVFFLHRLRRAARYRSVHDEECGNMKRDHSPCFLSTYQWISSWPSSIPSLGSELNSIFTRRTQHLQPNHSSVVSATNGASRSLIKQALDNGVHGVVNDSTTQQTQSSLYIKKKFFQRQDFSLTPRQHSHHFHHSDCDKLDFSLQHITRLEKEVSILLYNLCSIIGEYVDKRTDKDWTELAMADMRWAHFMIRSRSVNLNSETTLSKKLVVVPFLDMLNHHYSSYNVTYSPDTVGGGVSIIASRNISAGEELCMHYGSEWQRGTDLSRGAVESATSSRNHNENFRGRGACNRDDVRPLPVREIHNDTRTMDEFNTVVSMNRLHIPVVPFNERNDRPPTEKEYLRLEAQEEAEWVWRFGFMRNSEEMLHCASRKWSSLLGLRISRLTDARRHGKAGEFVIGVPEGLHNLREQRSLLERDRYRGARVFPPQKS